VKWRCWRCRVGKSTKLMVDFARQAQSESRARERTRQTPHVRQHSLQPCNSHPRLLKCTPQDAEQCQSPRQGEMADVTSLGVHTPAGLPYLINEGILPAEPKKELYQWDIYAFPGDDGMVEEEILATKDCVVWSQNGLVRTAYRFELEGEEVRQAVLTRFPKENASLQTQATSSSKPVSRSTEAFGKSARRSIAPMLVTLEPKQNRSRAHNTSDETSRALVVLLKTKAHVYFLSGSHHIVDLPFEIESAYAAPRGLILQKKIKSKDVSTSLHQRTLEHPTIRSSHSKLSRKRPSIAPQHSRGASWARNQFGHRHWA
jgi:hypothetical protein